MQMKLLIIFLLSAFVALSIPTTVEAGWVNGYYRSNGTYVQGYYRSDPNGLLYDNYSWNYSQPLYNESYGKYNDYRWNTPAWNWQSDYWTGYRSYQLNSYYDW